MRAIDWVPAGGGRPAAIRIVDQTRLPADLVFLELSRVDDLIGAIRRLAVRGAPALGVAGALGVALAVRTMTGADARAAAAHLRGARPTAVNLARGVDLALTAYDRGGADAALAAALRLRDDDIAACLAMARSGADLLTELTPGGGRLTVLTICNTGMLATVEHGTALGVIEQLHRDGRLARALACETRPLLQGSRLTAWELEQMGAEYELIVDAAAASILASGEVDAVLAGADRIARNGDTANKIGTFALALAARYAHVPFVVVAPETTVDADTASGEDIEVEDRGPEEVCSVHGVRMAPAGSHARNPAFDVTPAELITAIVTDRRVVRPPLGQAPADGGTIPGT